MCPRPYSIYLRGDYRIYLESLVTHNNGLLYSKVAGNRRKLPVIMGNWLSR